MDETAPRNEPIVQVTPKAVEKVRAAMAKDGLQGHGLRLAVVTGGCSGYEYSVAFAEAPQPRDVVYEVASLPVFVDADSVEKLSGSVLDYGDGLYGAGLQFRNPHAAHSCGCGTSFSTE